MKTEKTARKVYRIRAEARINVLDYIELFYNPVRRHWTLGHIGPLELEEARKA